MLGSELKSIRIKSGLNQKRFSKKLCITQATLSQMENGILEVSPKVEKTLEKNIKKEYTVTNTNKVFSRELFLKDMITGNKLVDDLYLNAGWLKEIDNEPVYIKKIRIIIVDNKENEIGLLKEYLSYILKINATDFYAKKEWIK